MMLRCVLRWVFLTLTLYSQALASSHLICDEFFEKSKNGRPRKGIQEQKTISSFWSYQSDPDIQQKIIRFCYEQIYSQEILWHELDLSKWGNLLERLHHDPYFGAVLVESGYLSDDDFRMQYPKILTFIDSQAKALDPLHLYFQGRLLELNLEKTEDLQQSFNYTKMFDFYNQAAHQYQPAALNRLAYLHFEGKGTPQNYHQAYQCLEKALKQNNYVSSYVNLGDVYAFGLYGTDINLDKAIKYYDYALSFNYPRAWISLASIFYKENNLEYLTCLHHAAAEEHPTAFNFLGIYYQSIYDISTALYCFKRAALQGHAEALYSLGMIYAETQADELNENNKKSLKCFEKAAQKGHKIAQYLWGRHLFDKAKTQVEYQGALNYVQSAAQYYAPAQLFMGVLYQKGKHVDKNYNEACRYFSLAAYQGCAESDCWLGRAYSKGLGVDKNDQKSKEHFLKSTGQNFPQAYYYWGQLHEQGLDVPQNFPKALGCYQYAAEKGSLKAQFKLGQYYDSIQQPRLALNYYTRSARQGYIHSQLHLAKLDQSRDDTLTDPKYLKWYLKIAVSKQKYKDAAMAEIGKILTLERPDLLIVGEKVISLQQYIQEILRILIVKRDDFIIHGLQNYSHSQKIQIDVMVKATYDKMIDLLYLLKQKCLLFDRPGFMITSFHLQKNLLDQSSFANAYIINDLNYLTVGTKNVTEADKFMQFKKNLELHLIIFKKIEDLIVLELGQSFKYDNIIENILTRLLDMIVKDAPYRNQLFLNKYPPLKKMYEHYSFVNKVFD
ncbi:MAG: tetratricopeptide repeat protein [Janthinobacterium lividum]